MNPDGTVDVNLHSYVGGESDNKVIVTNEVIGDLEAAKAGKYTSALKFTGGVHTIEAALGEVIGGRENVVDCNNGARDVMLEARVWDISCTKYGFTNKGGCSNNYFGGLVRGHGKETDFDQDNWSDQSHKPCRGTTLALVPEDGKAIRVRYIYEKPKLVAGTGPYRFVFPWPWLPLKREWIGKIFNQLRRWGMFR